MSGIATSYGVSRGTRSVGDSSARARHVALEEKIAGAAFDADDFQAALKHLRILAGFAPKRHEIRRRVASCYRSLKDYESAQNTLQELAGVETSGTPEWWLTQLDLLDIRGLMKDPEPQVELAHALLGTNPPPHRRFFSK